MSFDRDEAGLFFAERLYGPSLSRALRFLKTPETLGQPAVFWQENGYSRDEAERLSDSRALEGLTRRTRAMHEAGIRLLAEGDADFPNGLASGAPLPPLLFVKGSWPLSATVGIGIVGTREPSAYGASVARQVARLAAGAGQVVVSGAARGIDSAAHLGALEAGGTTLAILGTGLNHVYPAENAELYARICQRGALISQFAPAVEPDRKTFPLRNAVIAALSQTVVVVEGGEKSGARHTAADAKRFGKRLFAVPGEITNPQAVLPNTLIAQGAESLLDPKLILSRRQAATPELPGLFTAARPSERPAPQAPEATQELGEPARSLWAKLCQGQADIDDLLAADFGTPGAVNAALLDLELKGFIVQEAGRRYRPA